MYSFGLDARWVEENSRRIFLRSADVLRSKVNEEGTALFSEGVRSHAVKDHFEFVSLPCAFDEEKRWRRMTQVKSLCNALFPMIKEGLEGHEPTVTNQI